MGSYAAALAVTKGDRPGAFELPCLRGGLSPVGQNIPLPLKPLPPGCAVALSSAFLPQRNVCTSLHLKISGNQHA